MLSIEEQQFAQSPEQVVLDDNFSQLGNQVEDNFSDLRIAMSDLENIEQAITQAVDVAADLMDEADVVQQAQAQGDGASQMAIESIQRNVNNLLKLVGEAGRVTFAVESYSNPRHNTMVLESALDNIKAFIARIWTAIKIAFDTTMAMVKELYNKYFEISVKVKKRASDLNEKAKELVGKTAAAHAMVGSYKLSKFMRYDNKPLTPAAIVNGFDKWTAYSHNFIEDIAGNDAIMAYEQYTEQAGKLMLQALDLQEGDKLQGKVDALGKGMLNRVHEAFSNNKDNIYYTKPMLGDVQYQFNDDEMRFSIERVKGYQDLPQENTHELLSPEQVIVLTDKIQKHMDLYKDMQKYFKNLDDLKKNIDKIATDATKSNSELDYIQSKAITNMASFTIKIFIDAIRKVGLGARQHDMGIDTATTEWCALSLKYL